ncbi:MAG TPA: VOC family protein [Actinomycetospora sp.]|nr:VOC family protein [Actinomycetospora sp.]
MQATAIERPSFTGFHHYASAVTDLRRSAAWYERVLGLVRSDQACPGAGVAGMLLADPESDIAIRLEGADDRGPHGRLAFAVASRGQLDTWAIWLDGLGVVHGGVVDVDVPEPYAYLVFRDPDDVPLVLVHVAR